MRTIRTFSLLLLVALGAACGASSTDHAAILPPDQAEALLKQCSRDTPQHVDGAWEIPSNMAAQLEQDLGKLSGLKARQCCSAGESVSNPATFYRQYVGITIQGRKYVYINAFPLVIVGNARQNKDAWKHEPVMTCDGGSDFWGVLYDPETRQFSELAFNGIA